MWVCTGVKCLRPSWVPATLSPKAQGYSWDCLRRPHPCWKLLTEGALEGCVVKMVLPQGGAWPFVYLLSPEDGQGVEDAIMGMLWPSQQWGVWERCPGRWGTRGVLQEQGHLSGITVVTCYSVHM